MAFVGDVAQPAGMNAHVAPIDPLDDERTVAVHAGGHDRRRRREIAWLEHRLAAGRLEPVPVGVLGEPQRVGVELGAVGPADPDESVAVTWADSSGSHAWGMKSGVSGACIAVLLSGTS